MKTIEERLAEMESELLGAISNISAYDGDPIGKSMFLSNSTELVDHWIRQGPKLIEVVKVLSEACEIAQLGETQFDGVEAMHSAREALTKAQEILNGEGS